MIKKYSLLLISVIFATTGFADENSATTGFVDLSKLEPTKQFQFLVGDWTYATADNNAHGKSSNSLQVNDSVISETVNGQFMQTVFIGQALYFYDEKNQQWIQTWSDSLGNVMKSTVKLADYQESELPALIGELEIEGQKIRHIWYNISAEGYQTDLLVLGKDGETYQLVRRMPYKKD